jgi:hypothetical protein
VAAAALAALLGAQAGLAALLAAVLGFGLGALAGAGLVIAAVCMLIGGMDDTDEEPASGNTEGGNTDLIGENRRGAAKVLPLTVADLY